ncbi:hypothetical protein ED733_005446 [Metarhizium rileyi]|uniref:Uncharacterized protein n=1 Tax=Metarhizium rileyi (strain RCEF 4871) TaxID=1649241 RepID=A0A5C6GFL9_METRR|nr:hypothetical protein ED733_005446 [Metarhizium rileyi]
MTLGPFTSTLSWLKLPRQITSALIHPVNPKPFPQRPLQRRPLHQNPSLTVDLAEDADAWSSNTVSLLDTYLSVVSRRSFYRTAGTLCITPRSHAGEDVDTLSRQSSRVFRNIDAPKTPWTRISAETGASPLPSFGTSSRPSYTVWPRTAHVHVTGRSAFNSSRPLKSSLGKHKPTAFDAPVQDPLSPVHVREIIALTGKYFPHIPHAACGPSALSYHGCPAHAPTFVSVLVARSSVEVLRCWAISQGLVVSPLPFSASDVGIRTADGVLRCVRIVPIPEEELFRRGVMAGDGRAGVLSLSSLADDLASTLMVNVRLGLAGGAAACLRDLTWVLGRIVETRAVVEGGLACLGGKDFADCCLGRWPGLRALLVEAGA